MNTIYNYDFDQSVTGYNFLDGWLTLFAVWMLIMLVVMLIKLAAYIIKGIGLYTMAHRQGLEYPWLAFIPYARYYLQGEISGDIKLKEKSIKNPGIWMIVFPIAWAMVFGLINSGFWALFGGAIFHIIESDGSTLGGSLVLACIMLILWFIICILYNGIYKTLNGLIDFQIFEKFTTKNMAVAHAVLSILIPLYESISIFALKNRAFTPGHEPKMQVPPSPVMPETVVAEPVMREQAVSEPEAQIPEAQVPEVQATEAPKEDGNSQI